MLRRAVGANLPVNRDSGATPTAGIVAAEAPHQDAAQAPPPAATASFNPYCEAVAIGWEMEVLYRGAATPSAAPATLPDSLPTLNGVAPGRRTEFAIATVLARLASLELHGTDAPVHELQTQFANPERTAADVKRAAYELHLSILREANAKDRALGKAYELGGALANSCPEEVDVEQMASQLNRYRLDELGRWLADLASKLPPHASRAVRVSMTRWKIAAKDGAASQIFQDSDPGVLHRELRRQTQIWRALVTGEKQATDMLGTTGYSKALGYAISDTRRAVFGYLWRFAPFVAVVLALLAAGIWGVLEYEETSKVIASLAAIATALGISWKGLGATLGQLAGNVERPIWQGALDLVVADAVTVEPATKVALLIAAQVSTAAGGSPEARPLQAGKVAKALPPGTDTPNKANAAADPQADPTRPTSHG